MCTHTHTHHTRLCIPTLILSVGHKWLGVTLLLAVCSVLSKEQGITVVAVCLTFDVFLAQKVRPQGGR